MLIFFAVFIATVTFSALSSCEFYLLPANIVAVNIVFSLGTSNVVTFFFSFFFLKKEQVLRLNKILEKRFQLYLFYFTDLQSFKLAVSADFFFEVSLQPPPCNLQHHLPEAS